MQITARTCRHRRPHPHPHLPQRQRLRMGQSLDPGVNLRERARVALEAVLNGEPKPGATSQAQAASEPPTYDILGFLLEHAPLQSWQREIVRMVRSEAYYFLPQRMTKIINEGWASFWHSRLLTGGLLDPSEIVDFADCLSGATATGPAQLNPYKLGSDLFRHAEQRGMDLFRLRRIHNDVTFIDEFLTPELIERLRLFSYRFDPKKRQWVIESRDPEPVRERLLFQLTNFGQPVIEVEDANYRNRGELLLQHRSDSIGLDKKYAKRTLAGIHAIWKRPVHVRTRAPRNKEVLWSYDGENFGSET